MSRAWIAIVLAGAGTYAMRASFLSVADRFTSLPPRVEIVLRQIPPAVLAALVIPSVFRAGGSFDVFRAEVAAAGLAAVVHWKSRNVLATLVVGMSGLVLIRLVA